MSHSPKSSDDSEYNENSEIEIPPELRQDAINAALNHEWQKAVEMNTQILKEAVDDVDSLNRLGFANLKLGKIKEAAKCFNKVKSIDPYNQIAIKNLEKLEHVKAGSAVNPGIPKVTVSPMIFLEDPGKTKFVQCVNTAPSKILSHVSSGEEVFLKPKNHSVEIRNSENIYLGALPDDLSFRMIKYLTGNNKYAVYVRSVDKNILTILIREVQRGKKFQNQPSFLTVNLVQSYSRSGKTNTDKPDVTPTGEENEQSDNE